MNPIGNEPSPVHITRVTDSLFETRVNIKANDGDFVLKNVRAHNAISAFFLRLVGKVIDIKDDQGVTHHINKNSVQNRNIRGIAYYPDEDKTNWIANILGSFNKDPNFIAAEYLRTHDADVKSVYFALNDKVVRDANDGHTSPQNEIRMLAALMNWNDLKDKDTPSPEMMDNLVNLKVIEYVKLNTERKNARDKLANMSLTDFNDLLKKANNYNDPENFGGLTQNKLIEVLNDIKKIKTELNGDPTDQLKQVRFNNAIGFYVERYAEFVDFLK